MKSYLNQKVNTDYFTTKKFPAYGKQLDQLRRNGFIPAQRVVCTTDWKLGATYPRIVIPAGVDVHQLNFTYLAALSVQIVHHEGEADLVSNLIEAILKVKPKVLTLFNFDVAQLIDPRYSAFTLIYPAWEVIRNDL
ncbi:MAG: hypothetical protein H0X02_10235 [Nitrosomonas sp.]|nr:hypothetical protein [Nitrosomonas sp.]